MDIPALCGVLQGALSQEENQRKAAEALLQQVRVGLAEEEAARLDGGRATAAASSSSAAIALHARRTLSLATANSMCLMLC